MPLSSTPDFASLSTLPSFGTNTNFDTLAASYQTILDFGEDRAWDAIAELLAAHNTIMYEQTNLFMDTTTDLLRRYGTPAQMEFQELDELGTPDAQKIMAGQVVGFPLRKYGAALQWTRTYFANATGQEIAAQFTAILDADVRNTSKQIQNAFYSPIDYTSRDRLVRPILNSIYYIPVKALVNADGMDLPVGPNGEIWDPETHTHYLASDWTAGGYTASDMNQDWIALIETLLEHHSAGTPILLINRADETLIRALPDFVPYLNVGIVPTFTLTYADQKMLDPVNLYNRAIGQFHGAEVWVKPWTLQGYHIAMWKDLPKPFCMRIPNNGLPGALTMQFEDESHPLRAKEYERTFGIGAWNRVNGAVLYTNGPDYVAATIAN